VAANATTTSTAEPTTISTTSTTLPPATTVTVPQTTTSTQALGPSPALVRWAQNYEHWRVVEDAGDAALASNEPTNLLNAIYEWGAILSPAPDPILTRAVNNELGYEYQSYKVYDLLDVGPHDSGTLAYYHSLRDQARSFVEERMVQLGIPFGGE
jgi:hypothetical protein